jgi:hypothetical protein
MTDYLILGSFQSSSPMRVKARRLRAGFFVAEFIVRKSLLRQTDRLSSVYPLIVRPPGICSFTTSGDAGSVELKSIKVRFLYGSNGLQSANSVLGHPFAGQRDRRGES